MNKQIILRFVKEALIDGYKPHCQRSLSLKKGGVSLFNHEKSNCNGPYSRQLYVLNTRSPDINISYRYRLRLDSSILTIQNPPSLNYQTL